MKYLCEDIILEILDICNMSVLINFSLINRYSFNLFVNNKRSIGIRKIRNLPLFLHKKLIFNKEIESNIIRFYNKLDSHINYYKLSTSFKVDNIDVLEIKNKYKIKNFNLDIIQFLFDNNINVSRLAFLKNFKILDFITTLYPELNIECHPHIAMGRVIIIKWNNIPIDNIYIDNIIEYD